LGVKPPRSRPGQGIDPDTTKDVTIDGFINQSPGGGAACVAYVLGRPDCQRNPPLPACPSAHPSFFSRRKRAPESHSTGKFLAAARTRSHDALLTGPPRVVGAFLCLSAGNERRVRKFL